MAENELLVTISGAALSLLFYENVKECGEQMGFFIGNIHTYVTKNVTDSDKQVEFTKIHTDIQGILPCISSDLMYSSSGRLNVKKLEEFVKNNRNKIVGWYRFRQNGLLHHTLRDKMLHKELRNFFCNSNNGISEHHFVSCLLSYSISNSKGIHKFRHVFLRHMGGNYPPVLLKINNLGADASRHDGSDYKPTPIKSLRNETDCFEKYFKALKIDITQPAVVMNSVTSILKAAEQHLDELVTNVSKTDSEVANLEREAFELMKKVETSHVRLLTLLDEKKYSSEEPYQENVVKRNIEHSNRVNSNDDSQMKINKSWTGSRKRNSVQINNVCCDSENMKKPPFAKSHSQMTNNQPDATDC